MAAGPELWRRYEGMREAHAGAGEKERQGMCVRVGGGDVEDKIQIRRG